MPNQAQIKLKIHKREGESARVACKGKEQVRKGGQNVKQSNETREGVRVNVKASIRAKARAEAKARE
jgi:hypothetical protein